MLDGMMTNGNTKLKFKDSTMATSPGFCSGDDYMEVHSPTDSSEDSVEVKVSTITFNHKKRKLLQGCRNEEPLISGPLKKRMCQKVKAEACNSSKTPFRPWSPPAEPKDFGKTPIKVEPGAKPPSAFTSYFRPPSPVQAEPVSLVIKREKDEEFKGEPRVPIHPQVAKLTPLETERMIVQTNEKFPSLQPSKRPEPKREQRNYKNMTRERRIEANARERTRVHTISAAFETLRQSIPAYSHNQKLSKLSVLRIACSYIMTLSTLVRNDDESEAVPSTAECVDQVTKTIQKEGKIRKKKEDE
ncbi:transcription factor ATOH8-like isoform X3 [Euwallacea similis]|uniref:transcription factor ATOH8-like isoform X3 n=1 Tax=Euwallacea similis TaxID=1736056 RepID=UPI00344DE7DA